MHGKSVHVRSPPQAGNAMTTRPHLARHDDVTGWMRRYLDQAPRALSRAGESLQRFAKEQPIAAALAALGGSFLFARLISRR
jgi:hypothetical protein